MRWLVVVVCLLLAGCGDDSGPSSRQIDDPATAPSASSPTGPPETPSPTETGVPVLRIGDVGRALELSVGGTARVLLPRAEYDWSDPVVDGGAVTISEDVSDEGSTSRSWTITAVAPGEATVSVAGSPPCRATTPPCAAPDRLWSVRVTVS